MSKKEKIGQSQLEWLLTPKLWHGMLWSAWWRMLIRHRFRVSPSRWPMALGITLASGSNSVSRGIQNLLYGKRVEATELAAPPIFIVGHWRSGTTWLHELLSLDPAHTAPTTYECFSPCHFLLSEAFMTRWLSFVLPSHRIPDRMPQSWQAPQEDEPALMGLGLPSPYWKLGFPRSELAAPEYYDVSQLPEQEQQTWGTTFKRFLQEITYLRPQRVVVKCPLHAFRIEALRQIFPGCKFVYITRDPGTVIPSTMHLWRTVRASQGLQPMSEDQLEDEVFETFHKLDEAVEGARGTLAADQFSSLRYEDLKVDPLATLKRLYQDLDLTGFAEAEAPVSEYLQARKSYRTNRYQPADALVARIEGECEDFRARYGYLVESSV